MKEYRIQKKMADGVWVFEDPAYVSYVRKETAQERIAYLVKRWEFQKTLEHPMCQKSEIEQYSRFENWRIVMRDVTKWEPVEEE